MTYTKERIKNNKLFKFECTRNRTLICYVKCLIISFLLSGTTSNGSCACLGAAFVGASGAGVSGLLAMIGSCLGYSVYFGFDTAANYVAAGVVIYTISFVFQYSSVYQMRYFEVINVGITVGIITAFGVVSTIKSYDSFYLALFQEIFCCSLMAYIYKNVFFAQKTNRVRDSFHDMICKLLCLISLITSTEQYIIFDSVSIGRVIFIVIMLSMICYSERLNIILFSLLASVVEITHPYSFLLLYVLLCLFLNIRTKIPAIVLLGIFVGVYSYLEQLNGISVVVETTFAVLLYLIIPNHCVHTHILFSSKDYSNKLRLYDHAVNDSRIEMSEVLSEISKLLNLTKKNAEKWDTFDVFNDATEQVCIGCCKKDICWGNHQSQLVEMFNDIKVIASNRGKIIIDDFSEWFVEYCPKCNDLLNEINYYMRKKMIERVQNIKLCHIQNSISKILTILSDIETVNKTNNEITDDCYELQKEIYLFLRSMNYECSVFVSIFDINRKRIELVGKNMDKLFKNNDIINKIADIVNMRLRIMNSSVMKDRVLLYEAEPYAVSLGVATRKKNGESICGDRHSYFKTEYGRFYVLLSDGLGAGEHAYDQSGFIIDILERLLISGIEPIDAVHLTNLIASVNNPESWNTATIDLFCLDLYSGYAEILKLGAASSYLYTDHQLRLFEVQTLSAGEYEPDNYFLYKESFEMKPGDIFLITSDGISFNNDAEVIKLLESERLSMKILARELIIHNYDENEIGDDKTAITIRMEMRR